MHMSKKKTVVKGGTTLYYKSIIQIVTWDNFISNFLEF